MEPDNIRVEIEKRRKRAMDLKLPETLWELYNAHLRYYAEKLMKDPSMVYPEIRETLEDSTAAEGRKTEILSKNLKKTLRSKADEELYDILYDHSQDYTLDALGAAWDEFRHRQLDAPPISRIAASADKALKERAAPYIQFRVGEITYRVSCKEGLTAGSPGENFEGTTKTQITIALLVDEERVFEFEMKKVVRYTPEMPFFSETMGEVTSFIDGPWVTAVPELLQKIIAHENSVLYERQAPQLQHKLREDMKRFGL